MSAFVKLIVAKKLNHEQKLQVPMLPLVISQR